ncbi:MAG: bifunctional oligoribonuclease/PAP phosphatase NrnA [Clostridia bacterium]|nr:bifunctional oligoribonuclease/PAP phosphatase NrnA [Clostridia bacterium]
MTLIEAIKRSSCVLVIGHQRPDGDCLGAGLSVMHICKKFGKNVDILCDSDNPSQYAFMHGYERLNDKLFGGYDLLIILDCGDIYRMGKYQGYVKSITESFNIDHHKTNNHFAKYNTVLPNASSTCEIVYDLIKNEIEIDEITASLLYVGLSTDTGHFMHSNTTAKVLETAASLVAHGADAFLLSSALYKNTTINKTKLTSRALQSMRFYKDNRICIITVRQNDLNETNCTVADTEGLIDYGMKIGCVEVAICLTEQTRPHFKVSFRSKKCDVSAAASTFGGGGHTLAAGCVISGKYEDVIDKLLKSVTDGMSE